jgi:CBS-domain-containing membrane protein
MSEHVVSVVDASARRPPALDRRRAGVLPVVAEDGRGSRVVGLLAYRDDALRVAAAMSPPVATCRESDSLGLAVRVLRRSDMDAVPVVDGEGFPVGVLSFADLVRAAAT